jgi:hypothetical protein
MRSLLAFALLGSLPPLARADGFYLGLGAGNGAAIQGSFAERYDAEDLSSGRLLVGRRWDNFALEGGYFGTDLVAVDGSYSASALGLDLKYHVPLFFGLELYVKGGLHLARVEPSGWGNDDVARGRGYGYGVGLLWALRALQVVEAGVWLDLSKEITHYRFDDGSADAEMRFIMIGFSIGTGV